MNKEQAHQEEVADLAAEKQDVSKYYFGLTQFAEKIRRDSLQELQENFIKQEAAIKQSGGNTEAMQKKITALQIEQQLKAKEIEAHYDLQMGMAHDYLAEHQGEIAHQQKIEAVGEQIGEEISLDFNQAEKPDRDSKV